MRELFPGGSMWCFDISSSVYSKMCSIYCISVLYLISTSYVYSQNSSAAVTEGNDYGPIAPRDNVDKIPLYIGGYFSHGGVWDCSGVLPAVEMALDHINARSDILPDYDLRMVWNDTQCEAALGTRALFHQLFHAPQKLVLIGDGCSTSTQAIAGTAYQWNLNVISYAASAPNLSNRMDYPYFYRTIMPDTNFNPARIRLMKNFNWTKVATIHGKHELFSLTVDHLIRKLEEANITILTTETFDSDDPYYQIQNVKAIDAKIITVNMYAPKARRVLCEAYKNNMIGVGYVWMMLGWYAQKWWEELLPDELLPCSLEEMRIAARSSYYISTESLQLSSSPELTVANITAAEYVHLLREYMADPRWADYVWHNDNPFGYDATWAIALMLDKAVHVVQDNLNRTLEDFTYDDNEMRQIFFELLNDTRFTGVSGPVRFRDGDRVGIIQIRQLQAGCLNSNWELHDEECFLFVNQSLPYSQAIQHCNDSGAEIAAIINETEYRFIVDTLQSSKEYSGLNQWFIGLVNTDKTYRWQDSRFGDVNWTPTGSQLNSINGERCAYTTSSLENGWKSVSCNTPLPFICKMEGEFLERPVAMFTDTGKDGGELKMTGKFIWPGGKVPLGHTPLIRVHMGISIAIYVTMCVLASCGILLALFFLAFNIRYRHQRFVKMSSPNLNNLILLGSVLVYTSIFVSGLDSNLVSTEIQSLCCHLRAYFLSLGFVLAFGAMFSKTWRVHKIAAFKTPKRKIITDNQLFVMVFVMLLVDVCVLALWQTIDPMRVKTEDIYETDDPNVPNRRLQHYFEFCSCGHHYIWLASLYSYKIMMMVFGAFLALETRKVAISGLNDSKLIGMSVYNVSVLCTIGVAVSFVINDNPATLYIFTSCVVLFSTIVTLLIIFIPKIISVYKYPEGPPITTLNRAKSMLPTIDHSIEYKNRIENLVDENEKIKQNLAKVEADNKRLTSERNLVKHNSGCGLWCAGAICGCCSDTSEEAHLKAYRSTQNGFDNSGLEISGVQ